MAAAVNEDVRRRFPQAVDLAGRRRGLVSDRRWPGKKNLGLGRHWHHMTIQFWILTGAVYVSLVFATGYCIS
ncbi:MAG: hypothetical protein ACR2KJ_17785 [Jatrophihabitans sp.]